MSAPADPAAESSEAVTPKGPFWAKLQAAHKEISSAHEPLYMELPDPYEGIYVRYRYVPLEERKGSMKNLAALEDETAQAFWGCVDIIRDACDEIMVANPDDPRAGKDKAKADYGLAPLCDEGDPPIKFDRVLARGMEWKDAHLLSGRQIVRRVFGDAEGDYVLMEHARQVGKWMGAERTKVAEEFAGK